jgi:ABC-2 type transport system ATP-binding protein
MEIVAKNVCKFVKGKHILENINVHIMPGEVYGLVGPNGAGKSTFTRLLLNIYSLTSGTLTVDGVSVDDRKFVDKKYKIGSVLDNLGLYRDLTAWENVEFFHRIYFPNASKSSREKDIEKVFELVDLKHKMHESILLFSKGQKQRLALARAFINKPSLLILDEPTVGLDVNGIFMVREYIKNAKKNNTTVFINSHNLSELQKTCDTYGFIDNGKIVEQGNVIDLAKKYLVSDFDLEILYKKIFNVM